MISGFRKRSRRIAGEACLIRYADDFVCGFQYEKDAQSFYRALEFRLEKYGLQLAADKTRVIHFSRTQKSGATRFDLLGFEFYWGRDRARRPHLKRRTSRKKLRNSLASFTQWCKENRNIRLRLFFPTLNLKLRGYYNYYAVVGNAHGVNEFYSEAIRILFKWLNRRSQRRSFNWQGFKDMLDHFKVPRPRVIPKPRIEKPAAIQLALLWPSA